MSNQKLFGYKCYLDKNKESHIQVEIYYYSFQIYSIITNRLFTPFR